MEDLEQNSILYCHCTDSAGQPSSDVLVSLRESEVEAYVTREIGKCKGLSLKLLSPGMTGLPDRLVVLPGGRVLFVEFKRDKGVLSAMQKKRIQQLRDLGMRVDTIYGLEEAKKWVQEVLQK
jgi:hypothetical protein